MANHLDRNIVPGTLLRGLVDDPVRATPYFLMYVVMLEEVILPAVFVSVRTRWWCHGWRQRFTAFLKRLEMRAESGLKAGEDVRRTVL